VAWVYDPHTDEEGCFGWVGDKIEKLSGIRVGYSQNVEITANDANDYEDDQDSLAVMPVRAQAKKESPEPAWMRWVGLALGYFAAIILGVTGGFLFRDWQTAPVIDTMNAIVGCQHIQWQSNLCQSLLGQLVSAPLAPDLRIQPSPLAAPQEQASPLPQTKATPGSEPPVPAKATQTSPKQESSPAHKGNDAKH
jgi:hypothetical protein